MLPRDLFHATALVALYELRKWSGSLLRFPPLAALPIIVRRRRPLAMELEPLGKLDFLRGVAVPSGPSCRNPLNPGSSTKCLLGFQLDELKLSHVPATRQRRSRRFPGQTSRRSMSQDSMTGSRNETQFSLDTWKMSRIEELEHEHAHR